jgi:hypothetical protein
MTEHNDFFGARPDLIRGSVQSCYVIEHARAGLQRLWGGPFDNDAARTAQRADRLGALLDERGIRRPDEVIGPHTDWFESLCGSRPDEVPLGSAVLHIFGRWAEVFAGPYLGDDFDEFKMLGAEHSRVDVEYRAILGSSSSQTSTSGRRPAARSLPVRSPTSTRSNPSSSSSRATSPRTANPSSSRR